MVTAATWSGRPRPEGGLSSGVLALARGDDVAHDALVDEARVDPGSTNGLCDHQGPKVRSASRSLSAPRNLPVGVRTALTMTEARIWLTLCGRRDA